MIQPTISLRLATEEDWPECLRMAQAFHQFSPYSNLTMDEDKVRSIFDTYRRMPDKVIVILADVGPEVHGILVAVAESLYFSHDVFAGEIIWWVDEEYRKTMAGPRMFKAFEFWARKIGARFVTCVNTAETTDLTKFYVRNGYHLTETSYVKEL